MIDVTLPSEPIPGHHADPSSPALWFRIGPTRLTGLDCHCSTDLALLTKAADLRVERKETAEKMSQRAAVRGRPSGTDGSDFSYRMVVDSRYTKVAKAKSRLAKLIFAQVVTQLMIAAIVFVSLSKNESPDRVSVSSLVIGFVSVVAGELGRKKSRSNFLKFYVFGSSMTILLSVAYLAMSNLQLKAFQNFTSLETLKVAAVLLGFVVQLFVIGTTVSLIKNMAPPKRAS